MITRYVKGYVKRLFVGIAAIVPLLLLPLFVSADHVQVCTTEYAPVCGQPPEPACRSQPPYCMIPTPGPRTYGNRCELEAAHAALLYSGACDGRATLTAPPNPKTPPQSCRLWFDGCNTCSKGPGGEWMCTLMACIEERESYCREWDSTPTIPPRNDPDASVSSPFMPPPGCTEWYDGCNRCAWDGVSIACTNKFCTRYEKGYCTDQGSISTTTPTLVVPTMSMRIPKSLILSDTHVSTTMQWRFFAPFGFLQSWFGRLFR